MASVEELPGKLIDYVRRAPLILRAGAPLEDKSQSSLEKAVILLRARTGLPASRPVLVTFLERVLGATGGQVCEAELLKDNTTSFWASFHGTSSMPGKGTTVFAQLPLNDRSSRRKPSSLPLVDK